jgi:Predicted membrane protein
MTAGPTYIGAVMLFLAVLALFVLPGRKKWWLFIVSVLALLLSWGSNMMWFTELCFKILPGYNKFRAVSTALVIIQWSVPVLAALILSQIWKAKPSKAKIFKGVKWALGITGGIALFFALFGGMLFNFSSAYDTGLPNEVVAAMRRERLMMLRSDAWRSFIFVALSAGVVTLFAADKIKRGVLVSLMAVLVCADLIPVDMRYLSWNDFVPKRKTELRPTEADATIMQDKEPGYRVADLTTNPFSDARASYFHRSIGGYHGAKLQRYQDLIDNHLSQMNMEVYDMLNTKYFIVSDRSTGIPQVQLNDGANGPAWFVETVLMVHSPDEELAALNDIDTKLEAVVDIEKFGDMPVGMETAGDPDAYIALVDYKTNHLTYEYSSAVPQIAVFSEIYYDKGWTAYIDGEEASYFRADYVLRAMTLPAGEHTIEFRFAAPNFASVSAVTFIFSLLILLAFAGSAALLVIDRRKKKQLKV